MYYVYSTLTCDNLFAVYENNNNKDLSVIKKYITIKGGHGIASKHLITPKGVITHVNDTDMEILQQDYHFQEQVKHGFIRFEKKEIETVKAIESMAQKDGSAPLTPKDFEESEKSSEAGKIYKTKKGKKS